MELASSFYAVKGLCELGNLGKSKFDPIILRKLHKDLDNLLRNPNRSLQTARISDAHISAAKKLLDSSKSVDMLAKTRHVQISLDLLRNYVDCDIDRFNQDGDYRLAVLLKMSDTTNQLQLKHCFEIAETFQISQKQVCYFVFYVQKINSV